MSIRDDGGNLRVHDRAFGFLEPAIPQIQEARRWLATDLDCPNPECGAGVGELCTSRLICPSRMALAHAQALSGDLPDHPIVVAEEQSTDSVANCKLCGLQTGQRGSPLACAAPHHRCQRKLNGSAASGGGTQCRNQRLAGDDRFCQAHRINATWNSGKRPPGTTS